MEAISADGDFERDGERDGDFDFAAEAPRAGGLDLAGEDLDLDLDLAGEAARARAGEAARARAGDFSVFDFGCMRSRVARHGTQRATAHAPFW